ncbi:MAG: SIMPL domain-containing protein [Candidatus Thiodiazotropha sp. (ex Lucinoma annulata)]|nr:SIMPL domain-containing protein [Candidatus Thiodiazotropha sp. (ex Lucinoma annulata)]
MFIQRVNYIFSLFALCLLLTPQLLLATEQKPHYDRINLSAQAAIEVDNDTLIAVMYAQKEGNDLALLTDSVNQLVTEGVDKAKRSAGIKVQTLSYQTSPVYQQQRLTGWRVRQSIRLESLQSDKLSTLIGELQSSLALESLSYAISPAQRQKVEESLMLQAIDEFQRRADLVTKQLERSQYRLVEMVIQTSDKSIQPMRMRANMMALEGASVAPTLQAGSQNVRVEINGIIELQLE